jgi:bifunctional non-homologous end joining protein LigD
VRHASFQGLREDKAAAEVIREKAVPVSKAARGRKENSKMVLPRSAKSASAESAGDNGYDALKKQLAGVRLTSPDKVLYPEQGITKLELANYYRMVSDWILPHIADRPLVLVRCPEGREKACFYQKHPVVGTPDTLRRISIREKNKTEQYVIVDDTAGLISLAQIGALEIHAWGSRADKLEQPDRLIFDLDPDTEVPWSKVVRGAFQVRQFLDDLGLESFVKTTGGKGLHLVVPIARRHDWEEVKKFCKRVADLIVAADPTHYTANMAKAARPGKIFLDYLRNGRGATAIVPYSTRARPNAPVSTPLSWKELSARTSSDRYTVRNMGKHLSSLKRDPWEGIASVRQGLTEPMEKLRALPPG